MDKPYEITLAHLAENVRRQRKLLRLSQEELALRAGVDRTYVSQIERKVSNPSLLILSRIANVLGVEVACLLNQPG
jgi:transcriptional regulator with XRE-family HTH domain